MKLFTIVIAAFAVLPAFSTKAELPSHLRRLKPSADGGNQGGPEQEGGVQEWPGQEGEFGQGVEGHVGEHDFGENRPEIVTIECDAADACDLGNGEEGTWACRSLMVDSSKGDALSLPICIPSDQAWSTGKC